MRAKKGTIVRPEIKPFKITDITNRFSAQKFVADYSRLEEIVKHHRGINPDCRILIVSGSWDIIHIGHARYIKLAAQYADIVICLVDTDEAIRLSKSGKGSDRPYTPQNERMEMVAHLSWTDYVVFQEDFHAQTGLWKIDLPFRPTCILVSEREPADQAFYQKLALHCDEVIIVPSQATTSTSNKMRQIVIRYIQELRDFLHKWENSIGGG